ncbi:MAG: HesA/MoeB/ThiF family protein [Methylococcales bacterium]|nr:HesA/MoeB/ThiF family protein [Methylococcales bacterium]
MLDSQLLRYSRQIMLKELDIDGQQALLDASVLIIGAGGLGSPAAMYLAAAGVGNITLYDHDAVELTNLQRQIAHHTSDIGTNKAISTQATLKNLNPDVKVHAAPERLTGDKLLDQAEKADVVLDCSDNFATRFAVNSACVATKTPLVSGAAIRFEGQLSVFTPGQAMSPCYNCLYPDSGAELQETCTASGVIAPITGIIGSLQALEAIKLITGVGEPLRGRLLLFDGLSGQTRTLNFKQNPSCPCCGDKE